VRASQKGAQCQKNTMNLSLAEDREKGGERVEESGTSEMLMEREEVANKAAVEKNNKIWPNA